MTQRDIDTLEHTSGLRPLGEYPDHCPRCRQRADTLKRQATCAHESVTEVRVFTGEVVARSCADCGVALH